MAGIYSRHNPYGDNLARKRRRRFFLILSFGIAGVLTAAGLLVYVLLFSPWMRLTETNINGLKTVRAEEIFPLIDSIKNEGILGRLSIKPQQNILFFNEDVLADKLVSQFSVIKEVAISKEFPHKLTLDITERIPVGTWCLLDDGSTLLTTSCRYFDDSGVLWGKALRSSGSLLLSIDDLRITEEQTKMIDQSILEPIKKAIVGLDELGIKIKKIEIPDGTIGDFRVYIVAGYYILFNNESDIFGQIKVLKILLDEKGKNFKPTYVDLRIDGRIYYK